MHYKSNVFYSLISYKTAGVFFLNKDRILFTLGFCVCII